MSGKNNVNPGQYKVGGREKPGKPLGPEAENKESFAKSRKQERGAAPEEAAAPKENRKR
ncbi:MAG: hypothetical protein V7647_651 [Acidobacteriota bacterium]|jgi:hypothetical protein